MLTSDLQGEITVILFNLLMLVASAVIAYFAKVLHDWKETRLTESQQGQLDFWAQMVVGMVEQHAKNEGWSEEKERKKRLAIDRLRSILKSHDIEVSFEEMDSVIERFVLELRRTGEQFNVR